MDEEEPLPKAPTVQPKNLEEGRDDSDNEYAIPTQKKETSRLITISAFIALAAATTIFSAATAQPGKEKGGKGNSVPTKKTPDGKSEGPTAAQKKEIAIVMEPLRKNRKDAKAHKEALSYLERNPGICKFLVKEFADTPSSLTPWDRENCTSVRTLLAVLGQSIHLNVHERAQAMASLRAQLLMEYYHDYGPWPGYMQEVQKMHKNLGPPTKTDLPPLLELVNGKHKRWSAWSPVRPEIVYKEIGRIGPDAAAAVPILAQQLQAYLKAKTQKRLPRADAVPSVPMISSTDPWMVARTLGKVSDASSIALLVAWLSSGGEKRSLACEAIGQRNPQLYASEKLVETMLVVAKGKSRTRDVEHIVCDMSKHSPLKEKVMKGMFENMQGHWNSIPRFRDACMNFHDANPQITIPYLWQKSMSKGKSVRLARKMLRHGSEDPGPTQGAEEREKLITKLPDPKSANVVITPKTYFKHIQRTRAIEYESRGFFYKGSREDQRRKKLMTKGVPYAEKTLEHACPHIGAASFRCLSSMENSTREQKAKLLAYLERTDLPGHERIRCYRSLWEDEHNRPLFHQMKTKQWKDHAYAFVCSLQECRRFDTDATKELQKWLKQTDDAVLKSQIQRAIHWRNRLYFQTQNSEQKESATTITALEDVPDPSSISVFNAPVDIRGQQTITEKQAVMLIAVARAGNQQPPQVLSPRAFLHSIPGSPTASELVRIRSANPRLSTQETIREKIARCSLRGKRSYSPRHTQFAGGNHLVG